jgi:hypothetical protein
VDIYDGVVEAKLYGPNNVPHRDRLTSDFTVYLILDPWRVVAAVKRSSCGRVNGRMGARRVLNDRRRPLADGHMIRPARFRAVRFSVG